MKYADVIIDVSLSRLDKTFQYHIPPRLQDTITIGSQVRVSFGSDKRKVEGFVIGMSDVPKLDPARIRDIDGVIRDSVAIESQMIALAAWIHRNYGGTLNQALRTVIPSKQKYTPVKKKIIRRLLSEEEAKEELAAMRRRRNHAVAKERLLEALLEEPQIPWEAATGKLNIPSSHIRDMEKKAWLVVDEREEYRNPLEGIRRKHVDTALNDMQQRAYDTFAADYDMGIRKPYLLYGVTGSGKTRVYMEMIQTVLDHGKEVIVLIPEIALTYQNVMRFYGRFGDAVSILNSRMTPAARYDQMERAKKGEIRIMIGPRSALFTPFRNLGLIIMDEEHETSYKSETVPKYHARETAVYRAHMAGASVVLGSATPSLESFKRAQEGIYTMLRLPERVDDRPLPTCEIVDLRAELRAGNRSIISRRLFELMDDRLKKKEQIMLFINRRGLMGFVSCRACGHVLKCPHCDVSLSMHNDGKMHCHYCGHTQAAPKVCPECGSPYIGGFKAGTQRFVEVVEDAFPNARVLRMDMDTTKGKDGHQKILEAFANHEADILIGTQMIVKGHDFPGVTLVGALAADMSLNSSDYRGAERTFQLLAQAAGRAGRGEVPGEVVIQTYQPDHYAVVTAAKQDYESFYRQEIAYRSLLDYPPVQHLLQIEITADSDAAAEAQANGIAKLLKDHKIVIMGPQDAAIAKISDVYRKVIYIRDADYRNLVNDKNGVEHYLHHGGAVRNANVWFDFDPMNSF